MEMRCQQCREVFLMGLEEEQVDCPRCGLSVLNPLKKEERKEKIRGTIAQALSEIQAAQGRVLELFHAYGSRPGFSEFLVRNGSTVNTISKINTGYCERFLEGIKLMEMLMLRSEH